MTPEQCARPPDSQRARLLRILERPGLPASGALARQMLARLDRLNRQEMTVNRPYPTRSPAPVTPPPPPILGGQGRNPDDLRDGAGAIVWAVAALLLLVVALVLRGCL